MEGDLALRSFEAHAGSLRARLRFPLVSLAPAGGERLGEAIRTPHSVFYYALGYTGWVGVVLFGVLQFAIVRLLWRSYRLTGQAAGLAWWVMGM